MELKKEYKEIVYKRRADVPGRGGASICTAGEGAPKSSQILKRIDWVRSYYPGIRPAMALFLLTWSRFMGAEDPSLRITFDSNILWRTESLTLNRGYESAALAPWEQYLMELKTPGAVPLWVAHIWVRAQVYPVLSPSMAGHIKIHVAENCKKWGRRVCLTSFFSSILGAQNTTTTLSYKKRVLLCTAASLILGWGSPWPIGSGQSVQQKLC